MRRLLFDLIARYVKRSPPHPGRGMLARLAWRLHPRELIDEVRPGVRMTIRLGHDDDLAYWTGGYERDGEVDTFVSFLRPGMTIVDVGANVGLYAIAAARAVSATGRVLAFEPVPWVADRLRSHLALNGVTNVSVFPIALSSEPGIARLSVGTNDSQGSLFGREATRVIQVETARLADVLGREGCDRVDAVKIDVEGAELHVLRGMDGLLHGEGRPLIQCEIFPDALAAAGATGQEVFDWIARHGYVGHLIRRGRLHRVERVARPRWRGPGTSRVDNYLFVPHPSCIRGVAGR